jgi:uncharacterized protein (DUF927 family)
MQASVFREALNGACIAAEVHDDDLAVIADLPEYGEDTAADFMARSFRRSAEGVFYCDSDPELLICGPLEVVAETRDSAHGNWGLLLRWRDHDGHLHEWSMPRSLLSGDGAEIRARLMEGGLYVAPERKAREKLTSYLASAKVPQRARCVQRIGWHDGVFVLPDTTVGDSADERTLLQTSTRVDHAYRVQGTVADWQRDVASLAVGNSRLLLALSVAFAGPLLKPTDSESGGFHLRGQSSTGKSTGLVVAASVWGGGGQNGYLKQWRTTDNGLEAIAALHCDTLLCLDELSQVEARAAKAAAYMLANGSGKSRAGRSGEARPAAEFRIMFLSTGEISLGDKIAEDGKGGRAAAGQQVRIVDIPADAGAGMGMFEELHEFADAEKLASHLKRAGSRVYGAPARRFLEFFRADPERYSEEAKRCRDDFVAENSPPGADGQVLRVAARFGLAAAAGEIAVGFGILPWPKGEATRGCARCFKAWLSGRQGIGPAEIEEAVRSVMTFLEAHGSSRFEPFEEAEGRPQRTFNRVGWRKKIPEDQWGKVDAYWEFYATADGLREMIGGADFAAARRALVERGILIGSPDGAAKAVRVPGQGTKKLYHLLAPGAGKANRDA